MSKYSREARYKRAFIPLLILFILSVAADVVVQFTLGCTHVTPDNFKGAFSIYLIAVSLLIGVLFGLLACLATKNSYEAREHARYFAFARVLIVWILSLVGTFVHDNWIPQNTLDPGGALGNVFAFVLIVGLLFLAGQFFLIFATLAIKEPAYDRPKPLVVPSPSRGYSGPSYPREKTREEKEFEKFCEIVDNQ